jgi:histone H3/H4
MLKHIRMARKAKAHKASTASRKKKAAHQLAKVIKDIKHEQLQTFHMRRNPFIRVARGIAEKYKHDVRMSKDGVDLLRSGTEDLMIHLISSAADMAMHRGVRTIADKDILLATKTCLPGCEMLQ